MSGLTEMSVKIKLLSKGFILEYIKLQNYLVEEESSTMLITILGYIPFYKYSNKNLRPRVGSNHQPFG